MSKHLFNLASGCALGLALSALPAVAQESQWTYDLSLNLWFSETAVSTDTPFGTVDAELSFSDAIQDLDFAFMGTAEARNGPWAVIMDMLYFNLTAHTEIKLYRTYKAIYLGNQTRRKWWVNMNRKIQIPCGKNSNSSSSGSDSIQHHNKAGSPSAGTQ